MKTTFTILLCMVLAFIPVFAEEIPDVKPEVRTDYTLSLAEAIELAKENNPQLEVNDIKANSADISLKAAYINQATVKNSAVMFGDTQTPLVKKGYYILAAQTKIKLIKFERQQTESKIAYDVTQNYYNYILTNKLVSIAENALKLAQENKAVIDKYFELGMVAELDVKNMEATVSKCNFTVESYKRNRDIAKENLKISLNINNECEFTLTDDIECEDFESNIEEDLLTAMDKRYDVVSLLETYNLSKENFRIVGIYNQQNTANYNNAKSDLIQSEFNYTNNKRLIGLSIRNTYNNIITSKDDLQAANQDLELKKLEYDVAKIKFDVGAITNTELTKTMNALSSSEVQLEKAKLSYKLAIEKYQYEISIGL